MASPFFRLTAYIKCELLSNVEHFMAMWANFRRTMLLRAVCVCFHFLVIRAWQ